MDADDPTQTVTDDLDEDQRDEADRPVPYHVTELGRTLALAMGTGPG